jgi:hypothetical protein
MNKQRIREIRHAAEVKDLDFTFKCAGKAN